MVLCLTSVGVVHGSAVWFSFCTYLKLGWIRVEQPSRSFCSQISLFLLSRFPLSFFAWELKPYLKIALLFLGDVVASWGSLPCQKWGGEGPLCVGLEDEGEQVLDD